MLDISREQSTIIKGVAISMMLFLHLFNGQHTDLCTNLFYVGDVPLALWLTWAFNPVSFFLLLSGYGLACKYEKGSLSPRNQSSRIFNLYLHYWIVLAIFLVIGHLLYPSRYPGQSEYTDCQCNRLEYRLLFRDVVSLAVFVSQFDKLVYHSHHRQDRFIVGIACYGLLAIVYELHD